MNLTSYFQNRKIIQSTNVSPNNLSSLEIDINEPQKIKHKLLAYNKLQFTLTNRKSVDYTEKV
jgi:hypothetical protein